MLTVFIPFHNEEKKNIGTFLEELKKIINLEIIQKFIFVDDGSKDNTKKILDEYIESNNFQDKIKILTSRKNKGVGNCFKEALKNSDTKYIIFIPSDNDIPFSIFKNIEIFTKQDLDLVMYYPVNLEKYSKYRYLISMLYRIIYGFFFDIKIHYIQAPGLYKVEKLKKENFFSNRFSIWAEMNIKLLKSGIRYSEIGIVYNNKSYVDRSVSLKNLIEVFVSFVKIFFQINILKKKKYKNKSIKIYF